jgi:hypothetical protein
MKYGYARVSTDGQSVDAQVRQLTKAGCEKVFREVASGAKTDRAQLRRLLDRLARSTRDLLNTLAAITGKKAGFRSLGDTWADTTTAHGWPSDREAVRFGHLASGSGSVWACCLPIYRSHQALGSGRISN